MKKTSLNFIFYVLPFLFIISGGAVKPEEMLPEPDAVFLHQLYEEPSKYDGQKVFVTGEVIGDIMSGGEEFWINIKDGDFFMGVVIGRAEKGKIKHLGRYGVTGDTVKIEGTYNIHCREHFGERDIHAESLEIIMEGMVLEEDLDIKKVVLSFILGISTILFLLYVHRRKAALQDSGGGLL